MSEPPQIMCSICRGRGTTEELQGIVSREMALDACEPELEGQLIYCDVRCWKCGGDGWYYEDEYNSDEYDGAGVA